MFHSDNTYIVNDIISIEIIRMKLNLTFNDNNGNLINFNATYPGLEIYINIDYENNVITQEQGHIFIDWDQQLNIGGHIMRIDFYGSECTIFFEGSYRDQNCDSPIIIPINMTYKLIEDNYYKFNVYSFDTEITSTIPLFIKRKIQTIDVIFPNSVILGTYISIKIDIIDNIIVQPRSIIRVQSDELLIDVTIFIEYFISAYYYHYYYYYEYIYDEYDES
eukprot:130337_1